MFIVKWLMTHPIMFAWALTALAIILNWGTKSSHDAEDHAGKQQVVSEAKGVVNGHGVEAHHSHEVNANDTVSVEGGVNASAMAPATPVTPATPQAPAQEIQKPESPATPAEFVEKQPEKPESPAKPDQDQANEIKTPVVVSSEKTAKSDVGAEAKAVESKDQSEIKVSTSDEKTSPVAENNAQVSHAETVTAQANVATAENSVVTQSMPQDAESMLRAAREAFWHNKKDESAKIYEQLIAMNPDVPEYKGELGNVYWHQNKQKESAALYAEIAKPLIDSGKAGQVENMLGFIGAFYPEKASEIRNYLLNNSGQ